MKVIMNSTSIQPKSPQSTLPKDCFAGSAKAKMKPRAIVIADDLTGACDSGLAFVKAGHSVSVRLSSIETWESETLADVIALSTETRNLGAKEAQDRLLLLGDLSRFSVSLLFKKIDSVGRGNLGTEMLTTLRLSGCAGIVYAPAFPAVGRTVLNGILRVQDVSGQDTELNLLSLIPSSDRDRVALIPIQDSLSLRNAFLQAHAAGKDIWLCDSGQQDDLRRIASVASALPLRLLWAGSAGLAEAVAELMGTKCALNAPVAVAKSTSGCTLLFSGTTHPVTLMQLDRLAPHASVLTLDGEASVLPSCCGMVRLAWGRTTEGSIREFWKRLHQSGRPAVDSLVLAGGDTAAFVLKALHATSLRICGEVEPGIPWGIVDGGLAQGCTIITKSGGFGVELSLINAVDFCKRLRA
jgi:uncharacterized protein YgbK (DUF1537 family)